MIFLGRVKETSQGAKEIPERKVVMNKELKEIIDQGLAVESLEYFYSSGNDNMRVYVRGNKIKQVFSLRSGTYSPGTRYDTI